MITQPLDHVLPSTARLIRSKRKAQCTVSSQLYLMQNGTSLMAGGDNSDFSVAFLLVVDPCFCFGQK